MDSVSKKELIDSIATRSKLTKKDSHAALEAMIESIIFFTKKRKKVSIIKFGGFYPYETKATIKKNPRTGEEVKVPAKTVLKFKASKNVKI